LKTGGIQLLSAEFEDDQEFYKIIKVADWFVDAYTAFHRDQEMDREVEVAQHTRRAPQHAQA
jgi:hypothetical protein